MVMCPCCGSETDIPILFKGSRQYVFSYIWCNPGCTSREINKAVYSGAATIYTITAQIARIRRSLSKTCYALISHPVEPHSIRGRTPHKYKVIRPRLTKENANAPTILPPILP